MVNDPSDRMPWGAPAHTFPRMHNISPRKTTAGPRADTSEMVWESPAIQLALQQAKQVAPLPSTVLLLGETGVGKEVLANTIHELSPRRHRPMIRVSCAAIPSTPARQVIGRRNGPKSPGAASFAWMEASIPSAAKFASIADPP